MTAFFTESAPAARSLPLDLRRARQYLDDHLQQPLYLAEAAAVAGHSVSWLHRQFRRELQTTPARYITAARLRVAHHLLATSTLCIAEVGPAVGIDDSLEVGKKLRRALDLIEDGAIGHLTEKGSRIFGGKDASVRILQREVGRFR
jgi:AraC family transcriptional regulator